MTPTSPQTPGSSALLEPPHATGGPATSRTAPAAGPLRPSPPPEIEPEPTGTGERILIATFVGVPFLAVLAAVPLAWGWGLNWQDLVIALAIAGSLAIEGPVLTWVADHRRHHKYSDREGDPHSPWRFGDDWKALTKGLLYAHMGWMFDANRTSQDRFVPDLLADPDLRRVSRAFPWLVTASLLLPAAIGGLWSMSWQGALAAFFWASLVRIALLHHVTWSINSVCHTFGQESFDVRDKSRNVAWLAIASFGESWHNLHHADPTCARHGALKGQIDPGARVIWALEKLGFAYDVRWPDAQRLTAKQTGSAGRKLGSMTRRRGDAGRAAQSS
jgi:stearoyl-CoA desaturase (delta-9 desaturase)